MSQELVINKEDNVLAKCDLLSKKSILEIKIYIPDIKEIKYQLYYQANSRKIYFLQTEWNKKLKRGLIFRIYKVELSKVIKNKKYDKPPIKLCDIQKNIPSRLEGILDRL